MQSKLMVYLCDHLASLNDSGYCRRRRECDRKKASLLTGLSLRLGYCFLMIEKSQTTEGERRRDQIHDPYPHVHDHHVSQP
eukprot:758651-Hanusia_phi.AAC.4